ncbi:ankyrin, partial [Cadophora sp. DSE1049]
GFGKFDDIREALDLCLELQPGHEEVLMWSAVRHGHVDIVKTDLVQSLLARGADATEKTASRQLTCLHLLMLLPRHPSVDQDIFKSISGYGIEINAREKIDGLTAFHFAVRNQKLPMVRQLLEMGADPLIPVPDQLSLLSQGKGGYLERTPDRPQFFTENLTILGEVLLQYNQDNFYDMPYIADLLFLLLDRLPAPLSEESLVIDKGVSLTLLHILSTFPPHSGIPHVYRRDAPQRHWNEPPPIIPKIPTAPASLLQLVLLRSPPSAINARDFQGDTALHYACAAHQFHHIRTLLSAGANPSIRNSAGLSPVEVMAWSVIF